MRQRSTYGLGSDIDLSNDTALGPIVEDYELVRTHGEQQATVDSFGREVGSDGLGLLKVLEDLDLGGALAHGVLARVVAPHELEASAEALVAPRECRVDDVLALAAHDHEAAVGVVLEHLREDLARAKVLGRQRKTLAIGRLACEAPTRT